MKKILIVFLLFFNLLGVSKAQELFVPAGMFLGTPLIYPTASTHVNDTATKFIAYSFIPEANKTVNSVSFYVSAVAGSLDANDIEAHIYSTGTDGKPASSVASSATVSATPTGAAVVTVTGFTYDVTAGTPYFVVIKNAAADPTTNNFTVRKFLNIGSLFAGDFGIVTTSVTTDATAWTNTGNSIAGVVTYSDADQSGMLITGNTTSTGIYGSAGSKRHEGFYFTTPSNAKIKVRGAYVAVNKTGTPTGNLSATLRVGGSTYASINSYTPGQVTSNSKVLFYFADTEIAGGTAGRVTLENSQADSSSNCYKVYYITTVDSTVNKGKVPIGQQLTVSADNAGTWTEADEYMTLGGLVMSVDTPFGATASSGGAHVF